MKWKKLLYSTSITLLLFTSFLSVAYSAWEIDNRWEIDSRWEIDLVSQPSPPVSYPFYFVSTDGNCLMYGGIQLKPNTIHTYIPQFNGRYENITLDSGTLRLSKGTDAYEIASSTNDNITVSLNKWFYGNHYTTEFRPSSETETALLFQVNTRERGEPAQVRGVSAWSFNDETSTLSLTCANYSLVSFFFLSGAEAQFEWIVSRTTTWMGLFGIVLIVVTPVLVVFFLKSKEYEYASLLALLGWALGFSMMVAWLWG